MFTLSKANLNENVCVHPSLKSVSSHDFLSLVSGTLEHFKKGERAALCFEDSYLFSVSVFACLVANKNIIILPNNKSETLEKFSKEFDFVLNEESFLKITPKAYSEFEISSDVPVSFFTSGSSGMAKKVSKRFENLYMEVLELEKQFGEKIKDAQILSTVTHQHIYGFLFKVLWPMCAKRTFLAGTIEYPEQLLSCMNPFALVSTPAFLKRYELSSQVTNCVTVFSSGGLLSFDAATLTLNSLGVFPIEVYGSTESGGVAFRERTMNDQDWIPFSDVRVSVTQEGQLLIQSKYFDEKDLLMGDRAELTDLGFKLLERVDDIVKIEEKRISLSEINQKIFESNLIRESIVVALEENGRQQTACLAVLNEAGTFMLTEQGDAYLIKEMKSHLQKYFEAIVIPRKFRFVKSLPYNSQSKLMRAEVMEYFK